MAKKQTAPRRKAQAYPDPGTLPLPAIEVEADPRRGGDADFEDLDSVLGDLIGSAWPAYARVLAAAARLKRRVVELLPRPRRRQGGEPKVRKLEHPEPPRLGTGYAVEASALREYEKACLHVQANRLRQAHAAKAHAAINALFGAGRTGWSRGVAVARCRRLAETRVPLLIDQAVKLAKATHGRRDPTRSRLLLRDLERLRSFLLPTDRPHFGTPDQEQPTSSADVVADLRQRREELLEDRVAAYHGFDIADAIDLPPQSRRIMDILETRRERVLIAALERDAILARLGCGSRNTITKYLKLLADHRPPLIAYKPQSKEGISLTNAGLRYQQERLGD